MLKRKEAFYIIVAMLAGIIAGGIAGLFQKPYVETSLSFTVQNKRYAAQNTYDYEGYYTFEAANSAARALGSWLASPGGVQAVYRDAGATRTFATLRSYERAFSVKSGETPIFEVRYRAETKDEAEKISDALERLLVRQLLSLQNSDSLALFWTQPVFAEIQRALLRDMLYGGLLAAALAAFGVLFDKAMKDGS